MAGFFRVRALALLVPVVLVSLVACKTSTDLGKPDCHLLKKGPDAGPVNVTIAELSAGKDFLSFGSVECEDLVCVLDSQAVSTVLAAATANPAVLNEPALGYCSHACPQGSTSSCTPQFDDQQEDPALAMSCRQLVLDADTIASICNDPVTGQENCLRYFDNNRSPFFCARGGDGGI